MRKSIAVAAAGLLFLVGCSDSDSDASGDAVTFPTERATPNTSCRIALNLAADGHAEPDASVEKCDSLAEWLSMVEEKPDSMGVETVEVKHLAELCEGRDLATVCAEAIELGLFDPTQDDGSLSSDTIVSAANSCLVESALEDGGMSIHMEVPPSTSGGESLDVLKERYPNTVSKADLDCVLERTEMPNHVQRHIDSTRALDGQQTAEWGDVTARWTYHPDDGLVMTLVLVDSE